METIDSAFPEFQPSVLVSKQRADLLKQSDDLWKQSDDLWKQRDDLWKQSDEKLIAFHDSICDCGWSRTNNNIFDFPRL